MTIFKFLPMPNNSTPIVQSDDWKINVDDSWQVLWWCRYLGITKSELEAAINTVGNVIVDIKLHLALKPDMGPTKSVKRQTGTSPLNRVRLNRAPF